LSSSDVRPRSRMSGRSGTGISLCPMSTSVARVPCESCQRANASKELPALLALDDAADVQEVRALDRVALTEPVRRAVLGHVDADADDLVRHALVVEEASGPSRAPPPCCTRSRAARRTPACRSRAGSRARRVPWARAPRAPARAEAQARSGNRCR
jgi:hypothetical protein